MREVFLDELPTKEGIGANKNKQVIDWGNSIGKFVKFIYDDIEDEVEIANYNSKKGDLFINYKNVKNFKTMVSHFKKCQLGVLLNKYTGNFKIEIGEVIISDSRNLIIIGTEYRTNKTKEEKWYMYRCNKCGYNGSILEGNLLKGNGCSCCCPTPRDIVLGINTIWDTDPWMIPYIGEEIAKTHTKCSNKKVYPICPDCGKVKSKSVQINNIYRNRSINCECSDKQSYPNKYMFSLLNQINIKFESEKIFDWCKFNINNKKKTGRYDFYFELDDKKYIVEMDGEWHNRDNNMSGQTVEESQFIDSEKDRLAKEHDIEVIRIDAKESNVEYIKNNIMNSKLNLLFDLNNINWNQCEEFALSNLVKKVCKLKRDIHDFTTTQIGEIMKLHQTTITRYLKKGTKLGWCKYNPKEELIKSNIKNGSAKGKKVEVFKEGKSLGKFESCHDLDRQSEEKFGVKLDFRGISDVCNEKRKHYKGFTFQYIN